MKKIFTVIMVLMVSMTLFAERISPDEAALVANNFMNAGSAASGVQKAPAKRMKMLASAAQNMFYVYANVGGEGWVIVAADDAVAPILAYSETGRFRADNLPSNVRTWLGKYNTFIQKVETDGMVATDETAEQWRVLRQGARRGIGDAVVGPLVQTTWDQDNPYWNMCPGEGDSKAYTGCVATAMAQVMNYWQWPKQGTGSHSYQPQMNIFDDETGEYKETIVLYEGDLSADFGNTTYDWGNMLNSYAYGYNNAQANAVATLMFHCGVATEMQYGSGEYGGSGTYTINYGDWYASDNAQNALVNYFGYKKDKVVGYKRDGFKYGGVTYYKSWKDAEWTAMIREELDKKHPIMYAGAGSGGGHSFICDGYDDAGYFHFNWGWSGINDGYYKLDDLVPGGGGAGGGSYDFSEDQDVIIGIVPDRQRAYTVAGGSTAIFGTSWDPTNTDNDMTWVSGTLYELKKSGVELSAGDIEYKVCFDHSWAGRDGVPNSVLSISKSGKYDITFTFDEDGETSDATAVLKEEVAILPTVQMKGGWDGWASFVDFTPADDGKTAAVTKSFSKGAYEFKMIIADGWRSNAASVTRDVNSVVNLTGNANANMKLVADIDGDYIFTWTYETNTLEVTFPSSEEPIELEYANGYYLIGIDGWDLSAIRHEHLFEPNPGAEGEYVLTTILEEGNTLKVVEVENDLIMNWFPEGMGNEYVVDADHAGLVDIYFRPEDNEDWLEFGGYFFVLSNGGTDLGQKTVETDAVKFIRNGQLLIRARGHIYDVLGQSVR